MERAKQKKSYKSGNLLAALAAKQINYDVMGYYPITPSTQIAESLDQMSADGEHSIIMLPAEGEHSAAGICYGAAAGGGRAFNATSSQGLLYALEQLPVQSGTRLPMVLNVACRTVSGPLSIKGDHSDIMYALSTGWLILFASSPQAVYDLNICAAKLAEAARLPVIVAFDGFFTSHQMRNCDVFENDADVQNFVGKCRAEYSLLDLEPVTIGSYMNEPDIINNKYALRLAIENSYETAKQIFEEYAELSGRRYSPAEGAECEDADTVMFLLGASYHTARQAVSELRAEGERVGVFTVNMLRPFPKEILKYCENAKTVILCDRQDSFGSGGNMSVEIKAELLDAGVSPRVLTRIYGLGGRELTVDEIKQEFCHSCEKNVAKFAYIGAFAGRDVEQKPYFAPITAAAAPFIEKPNIKNTTLMPKRLAPGHGACPGCGIPVNVNLLLRGISGNVVLLFQTGCGMVVTTPYPKTAFRVPFIHNLFQNGAATISGLVAAYDSKRRRGEIPDEDITFIMVSGDGGMDIGMGSALGASLRGSRFILFEYDNGGYMNTGSQLSYSTPKGAKSSTSHVGEKSFGKSFFNKDMPRIMAATDAPYVATVAECQPQDFIMKARTAQEMSKEGVAYIRALSACPLNWGDKPGGERKVVEAAVNSCYFPLYEIKNGKTTLSYNPEKSGKKVPVSDWFKMMGRTKHLCADKYNEVLASVQAEVDRRWERLKNEI